MNSTLILGCLVIGLPLIVICALYSLYASIISSKNAVFEALSGIDVQLKKRHDLIPNVLTIAKKFMEHEKELFGKITELRTAAMNAKKGSKEKFEAEAKLDAQLASLMVNVENYPALKSDETMMHAMRTYNEVEENISAARRFYNSSLTQLKNKVEIFPGCLFASCAGEALTYSYFKTDEESKAPVSAASYL